MAMKQLGESNNYINTDQIIMAQQVKGKDFYGEETTKYIVILAGGVEVEISQEDFDEITGGQ